MFLKKKRKKEARPYLSNLIYHVTISHCTEQCLRQHCLVNLKNDRFYHHIHLPSTTMKPTKYPTILQHKVCVNCRWFSHWAVNRVVNRHHHHRAANRVVNRHHEQASAEEKVCFKVSISTKQKKLQNANNNLDYMFKRPW